MRGWAAFFLLSLVVAARAAAPNDIVDLNAPGALEAVRARHPDHYAKVQAILAIAQQQPLQFSGREIQARFDASDVEMVRWRVSYPPHLVVGFTLDTTRYTAEVVPALPPARFIR